MRQDAQQQALIEHENAALFTATAFGWWRTDHPKELSYRYWRDIHGVLAARIPGLYQYRQHHLASCRPLSLPAGMDVEQELPLEQQPHGIAQLLFLSQEDQSLFGTHSLVTKYIFEDEQNLVARNATLWSTPGNALTFVDRTGEAEPNGEVSLPSVVLAFQQAQAVSVEQFRQYLRKQVAEVWSEQDEVVRLRLQLLDPYDAQGWKSPGVVHTWPVEQQYQAWMELIVHEEADVASLFSRLADPTKLVSFVRAVYTFPIFARYTLVYDGRPTLVGLRGFPALQTIEQAGAVNQKAPDLLEAVYGQVVHSTKLHI